MKQSTQQLLNSIDKNKFRELYYVNSDIKLSKLFNIVTKEVFLL